MNRADELARLERSLKGAPAAIFLALVLHGGPQTTKMLCLHTGYSVKVVRQGLANLEGNGLAYNDSELRAWYLVSDTLLLDLLQEAMFAKLQRGPSPGFGGGLDSCGNNPPNGAGKLSTGSNSSRVGEDYAAVEEDYAAGSGAFLEETSVYAGNEAEDSTAGAADSSATAELMTADAGEMAVYAPRETEETSAGREDFTGEAVVSTGIAADSAASRARIATTARDPDNYDQIISSKQAGLQRARASPPWAERQNRILTSWLLKGGIGIDSAKMGELLARDLDLAVVKAHVLERLACQAGLVKETPNYSSGLLIRKLLDGDPPPPLRCEECLQLPDGNLWCGCDYEAAITR